MFLATAAGNSPDIWSYFIDAANQSPFAIPVLVLWILDLRRRNQVLEQQILDLNEQVRKDVVPTVTRLLDLVPSILARLQKPGE